MLSASARMGIISTARGRTNTTTGALSYRSSALWEPVVSSIAQRHTLAGTRANRFGETAAPRDVRAFAKKLDKYNARNDALALLGKDLAKRAGRKCELCEGKGDLRAFDSAPSEPEPELEALLLLCGRCRGLAERDAKGFDPRELRFLEGQVWAEEPIVAETAKKLLGKLDADWARESLDMLGE